MIRFCFILNLVLFQFHCSNMSGTKFNSQNVDILPSPTPTIESKSNQSKIHENIYELVIYTNLLERIFYQERNLGEFNWQNWITYRKETIKPKNKDILTKNSIISSEILDSLEKANQETGNLKDEYGAKAAIRSLSGNLEWDKFYANAKRKYPDTKGVVGFSKIGFNNDKNQALVYVEFYNPEKKLIKLYYLLTLKIDEKLQAVNVEKIDSFDVSD